MARPTREQFENILRTLIDTTDLEVQVEPNRNEFSIWLESPCDSRLYLSGDGKWRLK